MQDFFHQHNIPLPPRELDQVNFTKWGKNKRYSAICLGTDGIYCSDFVAGENYCWFPKPDNSLTLSELKKRKQAIKQAQKQAEEIRNADYQNAANSALQKWNDLSLEGKSPYLQKKQVQAYGVRYYNETIVIPIRDIEGNLWSMQYVTKEGRKQFFTGGKKKGNFHSIGLEGELDEIYICEGYATGASIYEAINKPVIIAFDAGNIEPVTNAIKSKYPNASIILCGDNDQCKEYNTGKETVEAVAKHHSCTILLPTFAESLHQHQPTDFNDLHILEGIEEVRTQLNNQTEKPTSSKTILPSGFRLNQKGLYYDTGKDDSLEWICSPIEILACTRDNNSENWGRLIRFTDLDGFTHEQAIPMAMLSGDCSELYGLLLSLGLHITPKTTIRKMLAVYLQMTKIEKKATCTSRIGWHENHFVLPYGTLPPTDEIYLQSDNNNFYGFRVNGTLQQWQEDIAIPCQGNSRLLLALSCAFAAPLLPLLHSESGGFNLRGSSSIGKSTALSVAASVWGSPKYIQQWKATGNALEAVAEAHNNALLCLDELGQVDGREAGEISYMLANGCGKNRMKAKGGLRRKLEWKLLFLSTGEISLADKLNEAGKKAHAGMLARMADIPADAGKGYRLFDTIHNFNDGSALANHLKDTTAQYYGTAMREFLPFLAGVKDQLPEAYNKIKQDFFHDYVDTKADGQVRRVAERFVIVATAGELAIKVGILPYRTGDIIQAIGICFQAWLEDRGSATGSHEVEQAIKQVKAFFEAHHSSRFALINESYEGNNHEEKIINQAGYKKRSDIGYEFFTTSHIFDDEICKGFDSKMVKKELAEQKLLLRDSEGKYTNPIRIPQLKGIKRMMCFTPSILKESDQ